jgi:LysR family transcriptional regulator, cell division regulator
MNVHDLKIFEAVAETGSFTKAATVMFTVQSNVTARVKSLEDEFGAKLFSRTSRKVELTAEGMILMEYCRQIQHLVAEAKYNIKSLEHIRGSLKIGCIETTMALKAPEIYRVFEEKYPDVELEFQSGTRSSLIQDVLNYRLDAAFVSAPINVSGLEKISVKEEQLVILTSSKGPKLQALLEKEPLKIVVFDEGCIFRERLESWLSHKGILNYKSTVLNSIEGIINFVEAGWGISMLPEEIVAEYYKGRKITSYTLNRQLGTMNTALVFRKDGPRSRALQCFIDRYL